jgi:hypothetical protein
MTNEWVGLMQITPSGGELMSLKKDMFLRMISAKKSSLKDELVHHTHPPRATSLDSIPRIQPKSILKKSTSNIQVDKAAMEKSGRKEDKVSDGDSVSVESGDITAAEPQQMINPKLKELADSQFRSSAPDLTNMKAVSTGGTGTVSKSSSTKSLSFNMEKTEVIHTYHKNLYNRKPDNDVTFKKLTPKLKAEIRDELNTFKLQEMEVHESSENFTVYH